MLSIWTEPSGYTFTNNGQPFLEQVVVSIPLPVTTTAGITFTIISGSLPGGLQLSGADITGTPFIISNLVTYQFCIRASNGVDFSDRTFLMQVNGANPPVFVTAAGELPVGVHNQLYAYDETYVSYQIKAFDVDTALGTNLSYFIASDDGVLPPGLTLGPTGLISGFILQNPLTQITPSDGSGAFDDTFFDDAGYDFALIPTNGYDSYQYDDVTWDYSSPTQLPSSLNQNYQFKITVTDGVRFAQRIFKIFVLGTDQFRADTTSLDGFAGQFTADSTFLRNPVWMSNANLGTFRANNYLSVPVVLYDNSNVIMRLETTNMEVYAVTKRVTLTDNIVGGYNLTITNVSSVPIPGQYFTFDNYVTGATERTYMIETVTDLLDGYYRLTLSKPLELAIPDLSAFYMGTLSALPPGTNFDINTGEIYGRVPYQPKITQPYKFTITAVKIDATINEYETVTASKEFSITILGSITSEITWNSPSNLGSIPANYPSTLQVNASSNVTNATVLYYLTNGTLPPGVSLTLDGELIGTPNQYYNSSTGELGLTTFDGASMTFDKTQTTVDRSYTFTVLAEDQYQYSAKSQTFTVYITTPNTVAYSNITTQPFLAPTQRSAWKAFINNPTVFTPSSIYRPNDPNFGLQTNLSMLVYAGIQTEAAATYVGAMGLGFKRKRFKFDTVKTAVALDPITNNALYEIVYVQMIDPLETNGKHLPLSIKTTTNEPETITVDNNGSIYNDYNISVDSTGYEVSNPNTDTYYPSSISTWQARLSSTAKTSFDSNNTTFDNNTTIFEILTERNYLPLWMRSIPSGQKSEPGYVLCVPLCYCKPGTSSKIVTNIQYSGFDFKTIDYTVDRFTISAVTGYSSDKYLVFRDDRITV